MSRAPLLLAMPDVPHKTPISYHIPNVGVVQGLLKGADQVGLEVVVMVLAPHQGDIKATGGFLPLGMLAEKKGCRLPQALLFVGGHRLGTIPVPIASAAGFDFHKYEGVTRVHHQVQFPPGASPAAGNFLPSLLA
jgi:hypothetical protein